MPDDTYEDDNDEYEGDSNAMRQVRQQLKEARKEANQLREQAEKAASLERSLAFRDAGIDPNDPKMSYFTKGYDGEISPDAIRDAAITAGFLAQTDTPGAQVLAEHAASMRAATGGETPSPGDTHEAEYLAALQTAQGQGPDQVLAVIRQYRPELVVPAAQ